MFGLISICEKVSNALFKTGFSYFPRHINLPKMLKMAFFCDVMASEHYKQYI